MGGNCNCRNRCNWQMVNIQMERKRMEFIFIRLLLVYLRLLRPLLPRLLIRIEITKLQAKKNMVYKHVKNFSIKIIKIPFIFSQLRVDCSPKNPSSYWLYMNPRNKRNRNNNKNFYPLLDKQDNKSQFMNRKNSNNNSNSNNLSLLLRKRLI